MQPGELITAHETQVHDIADIEIEDPVISLLDAQVVSNRYLEVLLLLNLLNLLQIMETNVQFIPLTDEVLFSVSLEQLHVALLRRLLLRCHFLKLVNLRCEFVKDWLGLSNDL